MAKIGSVSNGPVLRIRCGGDGLGISVFVNLEIRAFLIIPLAVSSIQPHLTFVASLQDKFRRVSHLRSTFYFLMGSINETFETEIGCSIVTIEPLSLPVSWDETCLFT